MIQAYATLVDTKHYFTGEPIKEMYCVYKPYYDSCGGLDDGSSDSDYPDVTPYTTINEGLTHMEIECYESMESLYELDADVTEEAVKVAAAKQGIELIFDNERFNEEFQEETTDDDDDSWDIDI